MATTYEDIRQMPRTRPAPAVTDMPAPTVRNSAVVQGGTEIAVMPGGGLDLGRRTDDDRIDGKLLLNLVASILEWWARWPDQESLIAATLFVAMTHFVDDDEKLVFDAAPRFMFIAPKGSGKTRMMRIMRAMTRNPTGILTPTTTAPGLKEALSNHKVPFLDEAQRVFGTTGTAQQAMQGLITGGYTQDTESLNARGGENSQNVFGAWVLGARPSILAANGRNVGGGSDEDGPLSDLFERSFRCVPKKSRDAIPDFDSRYRALTSAANVALELWGAQERPVPTDEDAHPTLTYIHTIPESLTARDREISIALLAVADRALPLNPDDPMWADLDDKDPLKWAKLGRRAVEKMLLGHGTNGNEMIAEMRSQMEAAGITLFG